MAEITSKYLFYVCLCMFFSNFVSTNLCNEKNPCLCRFSEHEILDISNVTKKDIYLKASWKSFDFFYSPCHNMDMKLNPKTCQNTSVSMWLYTIKHLINVCLNRIILAMSFTS